ncbi:MAG: substrate-binding domain-containing protein [Spirochaetota bacterium]
MSKNRVPEMKYDSIAAEIRQDIKKGVYSERIPGERVIAEKYGINFKTANKAISSLVSEGILYHVRGKGAFISKCGTRNDVIGLFLRTTGHTFEPMTNAMISALQRGGFLPLVHDTADPDFALHAAEHIERVLTRDPEAIVMEGDATIVNGKLFRSAAKKIRHLMFVRVSETLPGLDAVEVVTDPYAGAFAATDHLASLGHTRIALVIYKWIHGELLGRVAYRHRYVQGYIDALEKHRLAPMLLEEGADEAERLLAWETMLSSPARPTALFSVGDFRIVRAFSVIKKLGLSVPNDLALVGHDNTPWCTHMEVPLTSVSIKEEEIARIAAERILTRNFTPERIVITPELIVRASSDVSRRTIDT